MVLISCNAGSTSLKLGVIEMPGGKTLASEKIERIGSLDSTLNFKDAAGIEWTRNIYIDNHVCAARAALGALKEEGIIKSTSGLDGIAFKAVHGGALTEPTLIDDEVLAVMERFITVAPLHNRVYLDVIRAFRQVAPKLPMVAVFETAFHNTMPEYAYTYAVPLEWKEKYGVRKYGFHGASHSYINKRIQELTGRTDLKVISCHLGGSSSLCALQSGVSIDATQGFSPQSGISMGTRNGDLDVYIIFYLVANGFTLEEINDALYTKSGLKGLSGISEDTRDIELAASRGDKRAELALQVYCYDIVKYIGAYWALLGGLDAIVFTGGIGENSIFIRAKVLRMLEHMGVVLDADKNQNNIPNQRISTEASRVDVYVIRTNEELMVAEKAAEVLSQFEGEDTQHA
ncbi:MAG: acetate/propionate family kinase [Christensenellaceae bacterium]|jgi:acetate kinase|nr:acetate/propionate family kinase [Christensenellaceae bacterium]